MNYEEFSGEAMGRDNHWVIADVAVRESRRNSVVEPIVVACLSAFFAGLFSSHVLDPMS